METTWERVAHVGFGILQCSSWPRDRVVDPFVPDLKGAKLTGTRGQSKTNLERQLVIETPPF